jgi:hypothetical protein
MKRLFTSLVIAGTLALSLWVAGAQHLGYNLITAKACGDTVVGQSRQVYTTFTNYYYGGETADLVAMTQLDLDTCRNLYYGISWLWTSDPRGQANWGYGRGQFTYANGSSAYGVGFGEDGNTWSERATTPYFGWGPNIRVTDYQDGGTTSFAVNATYWYPNTDIYVPAMCWSFTYGRNC